MTPDNKLQTDDTEAPMKHTMTSKQKTTHPLLCLSWNQLDIEFSVLVSNKKVWNIPQPFLFPSVRFSEEGYGQASQFADTLKNLWGGGFLFVFKYLRNVFILIWKNKKLRCRVSDITLRRCWLTLRRALVISASIPNVYLSEKPDDQKRRRETLEFENA